MFFKNTKEDALIDRSKELSHIAFECPHSLCMVARNLASEAAEAIESLMDSFIISARIRVGNE